MSETLGYVPNLEKHNEDEPTIYHGRLGKAIVPSRPLIPPDGGVNLTVVPNREIGPYFSPKTEISDTIPPFLLSLATARAVVSDPKGGRVSRYSQWVNVDMMPRFGGEDHFQAEVIGKNAMNESAWAMPTKYPKGEGTVGEQYPGYSNFPSHSYESDDTSQTFPVVEEEIRQISQLLPSKESEILAEAGEAVLFSGEFSEDFKYHENAILRYRNYEVVFVEKGPHVKEGGLHFWIHKLAGEHAEGVQDNVKNGLEQFILATIVSKAVYRATKRIVQIRFMGNWGLPTPLQQKEALARGKDPSQNYINENLSAHANLYVPPIGEEHVELPERPVYENPDVADGQKKIIEDAIIDDFQRYITEFEGAKIDKLLADLEQK